MAVPAAAATAPARHYWGLAAPGTALPRPDAYCAARVQLQAERIHSNVHANHTMPPPGTNFRWGPWTHETPGMARNFTHVDGRFTGTTDEIIEWAACKWGMDQNIAKAQAVAESSWRQAEVGDHGESFGILQVRASGHGPASADNGWGGWPWTQRSTALNADAQMAWARAAFDGHSYMGAALRGQIWRVVSAWQSGYNSGWDWYTAVVAYYLAHRSWTGLH